MMIFEKFLRLNRIKRHTKTHQIAPFKKNFRGACPRTPLAKRMVSLCAACRFATCKFQNLTKKILSPPLPNPGYAPDIDLFISS